MNNTIVSSLLLLMLVGSQIKPTPDAIESVNEKYTFGKELTLAEICQEADGIVLCTAKRVDDGILPEYEGYIPPRVLEEKADETMTEYVLTVHESFKGKYAPGREFLVHLPGGRFGRHTVDFGFPAIDGEDAYYLIPMIERWGAYVPMLDAMARLSDFWDMDGNGMINFDADKLAVIEQLGISGGYGEFESSLELFDAIEAAVGVTDVVYELSDEYSLNDENYTLSSLSDATDALIIGRVDSAEPCFGKVQTVDESGKIRTEIVPHTCYRLTVYDDTKGTIPMFERIELELPVGVINGLKSVCGAPELEVGREYVIPLRLAYEKYQPIYDCIAAVDELRDYNGDGCIDFAGDTGVLVALDDNGLYDNVTLAMIDEYCT